MYAQIERAAERDHRKVAGWVKALIAKALEEGTAPGTTPKREPGTARKREPRGS